MTLIDGVGDEVTDFFIIVSVLLVGWLAWCSTSIADQPLIRTVLILQHRTRTRIAELRAGSQTTNANTINRIEHLERTPEVIEPIEHGNDTVDPQCPTPTPVTASIEDQTESNAITPAATSSEEALIEAMDTFNNDDSGLRQRIVKIESANGSTDITDSTDTITTEQVATEHIAATAEAVDDANQITIKLKFINDDQKVVKGSPEELLGDFKRRHFQVELASQKLVRLVFNGQVLQPDTRTLERCGLYHNCVVHCLVHQQRPNPTPSAQSGTSDNASPLYFNPQSFQDLPTSAGLNTTRHEWDLSRLLVSILILILGLAWYSRYHYAQLFTATTTLALYALTAIFTISLFGHFFPDQDSIRNIE
ncbi:transmembrane and ubiquitin-like domain-containing protein 1 [Athalia rosae]|uniref:transmembrane and ubiquitin-like domain-containing protein 1 n=1 Tax=Athalia rosae TaxID=37344 RepID=UPI002033283C|nr:transmembrane and ubiquitin-like domain-containing protein 1 [Athalia rosae]XP_012269165.2 transmembrane and ubiquitin-like domain-containing protein 1 [Athalia rosae]